MVAGRDSEDMYASFFCTSSDIILLTCSLLTNRAQKTDRKFWSNFLEFFGSFACSVYVEICLQAEEVDTRWSAEKAQFGAELLKYIVIVAEESKINY